MRSSAITLLSSLIITGSVCAAPALATQADSSPYVESGQASWYGPRHEGQRTSSGERFDSSKMTAAHSSLPMNSYVRVTEQRTGRSVIVRVNDREPPHGVRCIDLSHAAAQQLGMAGRGVADVVLAEVTRAEATEIAEAPLSAMDAEDASAGSQPVPAIRRAIGRHGQQHTHHAHQ